MVIKSKIARRCCYIVNYCNFFINLVEAYKKKEYSAFHLLQTIQQFSIQQFNKFVLWPIRGVVNSKKSSYTLGNPKNKKNKKKKIPKIPKFKEFWFNKSTKFYKNRFFSLSILIPLTLLIIPLGLLSVSWSVCCQCHARNF